MISFAFRPPAPSVFECNLFYSMFCTVICNLIYSRVRELDELAKIARLQEEERLMMASKLPVPNSNSDTFIVAPMDETVVLNKPSTTAVVSVTPARATIPSESYQMTPHGTDKVCLI